MTLQAIYRRRVVLGTPITPRRLLATLAGSSFCVSYARPDQLEECIRLVGEREVLVLDNGAFSHWRAGRGAIDAASFWTWANAVMARCENAVAVIPDVIEGSEDDNLMQIALAVRGELCAIPQRAMGIWHLNESLAFLERQCRLLNFVGLGSCAQYDVQRHRAAYVERIGEAFAVIERVEREHGRRPWVHLMRGLGVLAELVQCESADSCNVAVNHARHTKAQGEQRAAWMKARIEQGIEAGLARAVIEPTHPTTNFDSAPTLRPRSARGFTQAELSLGEQGD